MAITKAVAHGVSGGIFAEIGGGEFSSGFLAAGFTSLAGGGDFEDTWAATAYSAVTGGIGAELGGGKFADGAQTGAFTYLFNEVAHRGRSIAPDEFRPPNEDLESLLARIDGAEAADIIDLYHSELTLMMQSDVALGDPDGSSYQEQAMYFADGLFYGNEGHQLLTFRAIDGPLAGTFTGGDINYYVTGFVASGRGVSKWKMRSLIAVYNTVQSTGFDIYGPTWKRNGVSPRNIGQIRPALKFANYGYDYYEENR